MTLLTPADAPRVARLARLDLAPEELARLAPALEAITREFAGLAARAESLPPLAGADDPPGELRADDISAAPPEVVDSILRAAEPRVDHATRAIVARDPRGGA